MPENNQKQPQTEKRQTISIPLAIIAAGFLIALGLTASNYFSKQEPKQASIKQAIETEKDSQFSIEHSQGNPQAAITIVEFSDFQCSFCSRFHLTMKQVIENYGEQVRWVYKHFPLNFHEQAQKAAEASECAAEQGKFWEFTDGLFENQAELGPELYQKLAQQLALDMDQFNGCLSRRKYKTRIEQDYEQGVKAGVTGTPTTFINDKPISGAVPYSTLEAMIQNEL